MRASALSLVLIASATPRVLGQTAEKSVDAALIKSAAGGAAANKGAEAKKDSVEKRADPVMDKLFLICKKTGKCDDYLLEKERRKREAPLAEERAGDQPLPTPTRGTPSGGGGGDAGAPAAPAPPPSVERIEAMRQEAGERSRRTMGRATGDAEALRRSLPSASDLEDESGPGPRPTGSSGRAPDGLDSANPRTVPEMALAQRTGFSAAFDALGLKVGAGPRGEPAIQRVDGAPATPRELEVLGAVLRSEPVALLRRPDFFDVLSREKFAGLKRDYARLPEARAPAFKDIGMTERGRDFQWSASCSGLSGDCNGSAGEGSYRRGQYVSPEDLERVWAAAHEGEEPDDFEEYTEEDLRLAAEEDAAAEKSADAVRRVRGLSGMLSRMGESLRSWGEGAGLLEAEPVVAAGAAGVAGVGHEGGRAWAERASLRGSPDMPPPVPEAGRAAKRLNWLFGLAAAALLIFFGLRRRA